MIKNYVFISLERGEKSTFRGCQLDGGKTDVCEITRSKAKNGKNQISIDECLVCKEDNCNESTLTRVCSEIIVLALLLIQTIR